MTQTNWHDNCVHCYGRADIQKYGLCRSCYNILRRKRLLKSINYERTSEVSNVIKIFDRLFFDTQRKILFFQVTKKEDMPDDATINTFKNLHKEHISFDMCDGEGRIINATHHFNNDPVTREHAEKKTGVPFTQIKVNKEDQDEMEGML